MALTTNPQITSTPPVIPMTMPNATSATSAFGSSYGQSGSFSTTDKILDAAAGPKCNLIWASSIDEILAYPTSPNEHTYFGDKNDQIIYERETDANGNIKNPLKALHYTIEEIPFGQEAKFVTKDEHRELFNLVEKLSGNVDSMNQKLEKLLNG